MTVLPLFPSSEHGPEANRFDAPPSEASQPGPELVTPAMAVEQVFALAQELLPDNPTGDNCIQEFERSEDDVKITVQDRAA